MGCVSPVYRPRDAEHTVLHQVVAEHLESFLGAVAEAGDGAGLPQFVEREFREFLRCRVYEHGVVRFQCEGCGREQLVPVSCKRRGWCPSCGGRRMTERAAHLVDAVLPWVPVRQWVLTVPYRLRYRMAFNHGLSRAVLGIFTRVLLQAYARDAGARGIAGGRTGSITVIQRGGGGLNINPHFHTLVLDGVFREVEAGGLEFHPAPGPSDDEVAAMLARIRAGRATAATPWAPARGRRAGVGGPDRRGVATAGGARERGVRARGPRQAHLDGFALDVLACPHCGGRLIATLHDPAVIRTILAHRGRSPSEQSPGPAPPAS